MDFDFTDDQVLLRDTVRNFVSNVCPPSKAKEWDESGHYPDELFRSMGELGWTSLPFPESAGGGGGGPIELAIIAEELSAASFDIAMCYIASLIAGLSVDRFATSDQRQRWFPDVFEGTSRFSISISEPDAGSDVKAMGARAERVGDTYLASGQKMWCTGAGLPNTLLAMYLRTGGKRGDRDGLSLFIVDPTWPGVELRQIPTLARHILGTYEVFLNDVEIPVASLVGEEGEGWKVLLSGLELERVLLSGGYVGVAQATIDEALEYSKTRHQFGERIGDFQAIAHSLADLQTEVDAARLLAYRAAWLLEQGRNCAREGSMAKLFGSELYVRAARQGMQIMGGYGFSTESIMSFRYRESIVAPISGGTSQIQRNGIARAMGLRP